MNGNQGLEALAALCGGEAAVATDSNSSATSNNNGNSSAGNNGQPAEQPPPQQQQPQPQQTAEGLTRQQWQQAVAAAAALGSQTAPAGAGGLAAQSLALLSAAGLQQQQFQQQQQQQLQQQQQAQANPNLDSNAALAAMQQLAYFRYIQEQTNAAVAKIGQNANNPLLHSNPQAVALALAGHAQQLQQQLGGGATTGTQQVLPPAAAPSPSTGGGQPESSASSTSSSSMPPPPTSQGTLPSTLSTAGIHASPSPAARQHTAIAPLPNTGSEGATQMAMADRMSSASSTGSGSTGMIHEDKKLQKRAANRRSAQLSRKRKKQFIEELKDENDELRRKEQILRSIPDLIVVFDSTGKLWFVSQSVSRFMNMSAQELEGTSFWDRLCEDSVRLLKAAFMDSLAARTDDSDTAPLGSGIWELRLVDKDGTHKVVSLNGVVHFSGDRPECVCSIRPRDDPSMQPPKRKQAKEGDDVVTNQQDSGSSGEEKAAAATVSTANGGNETATTLSTIDTSDSSVRFQPLIRVKPHQSVISSLSSSSASSATRVNQKVKAAGSGKRREAARISDGDSASADSGSSDEMGE